MNRMDWTVIETAEAAFNPTQLHHKETVFTLSNGYLGTRGSFEEGYPGDGAATLINGVYDDAPIVSPELVNCPDWLSLQILIDGDRFRLDQGTVLRYERSLDLQQGVLSRQVHWQSPKGHTLALCFERFVSLADEHVVALCCQLELLNSDAAIEVHASLNSYADNNGFRHWSWLDQGGADDQVWLRLQTRASQVELGMATCLRVTGADAEISATGFQGFPTLIARVEGRCRQPIVLEKVVTVYTSRETASPAEAAQAKLAALPSYSILLAAHAAGWAQVWSQSDVVIEGDSTAQLAIRYNLFQVLSAAPRHDSRVSIPAKTLSGFAYRGHIFWDTEVFILPLLTLTQPDLARNLLTYRYHGLAGARRKAQAAGYEGAMYVWESADTGDETTPRWVPGPDGNLVRIWCGEIEVHISTDVAYAAYQYWRATGDDAWMRSQGAEMILDTAVFWGSRVVWNPAANRYEILNVIGPDEYHEQVNNNAFTNRMVQWHLKAALEVWSWLQQVDRDRAAELEPSLNLSEDRLRYWQDIVAKLWVPQNPETGLFEQFEGFFGLEDIQLADYEPRSRSMQAILGIEGANQRQVLKQADVLMLLYLLRQGTVLQADEGYDRATVQTNWDYYEPRTDHTYGSSLAPPVHAILACDLGNISEAYDHFMRAALVDLADVRGNAAEGIHAASAGGVWQTVVFGFGGVRVTEGGLQATPRLPAGWTRLKFQLRWQGQTVAFDLRSEPKSCALPTRLLPIAGVIFDLDGVLTDTSEFHYLGWKRLADEEGIPFDRERNEALRGVSRRDSLRYLLDGRSVTEAQLEAMMARKNAYYLELIQTITPDHLLPGVLQLLEDLQTHGIKIAIGSASKNAREVVQRLGIADRIDAIADGYSVANSKPAPDVFLHAAALLDLEPTACIVVEDAASGVEAALRAGAWTIGLGPAERVGAAHLVLPNLATTRWVNLRNYLSVLMAPSMTLQCLTDQVQAQRSQWEVL